MIPHTAANTTLLSRGTGDKVNIECDIIGKYVERLMTKNKGVGAELLSFLGTEGGRYH